MTASPLKPRTVQDRIAKLRQKQAEIENEIRNLKKRCAHDWVFQPDPSGNNDSEYQCSACGLTTRKRP